jgi:hypothetical protein
MAGNGADSDSSEHDPAEAAADAADIAKQYYPLRADTVSNPAALLTLDELTNLHRVQPTILKAFLETRGIVGSRRVDNMVRSIKQFHSEQQATVEGPQAAGALEVPPVEMPANAREEAGGGLERAADALSPAGARGADAPQNPQSRRVFLHAALTALIVPIPSDDRPFTKTIGSDIQTILIDLQTIVCQTIRRSHQPSDDRFRPSDDRMRSSDDRMRSSDDRLSDLQTIVSA